MIPATAEPRRWSPGKFWGTIALVFALQLALIFWLGNRPSTTPPRLVASAPRVRLSHDSGELLALLDPTLFALPHHRRFSGKSWIKAAPQDVHPADWSETPLWLELPMPQLTAAFRDFVQTSGPLPFQAVVPEPSPAVATGPGPAVSTPSTLRIEGGLSGRRLLSSFGLSGWTNSNLLTNSVVQVVVDAQGNTLSRRLLSGSGYVEADRRALELAKIARFAPEEITGPERAKRRPEKLTLGTLTFEWQTLPPTNALGP